MVSKFQTITDFQSLCDKYQLFLFDQYGVLHNGTITYSGMHSVLLNLKQQGKTIGVISNSGKRADVNAERLSRFGYGSDVVDKVWTSGELAWQSLRTATQSNKRGENVNVFYLGNDQDRSALQNLPVIEVALPEQADIIIIAGVGQTAEVKGNYKALFQPAAEKGIPAYCSNPDLLSFFDNACVADGPGTIAMLYMELGGPCTFYGKPHVEIYQHIFKETGVSSNRTLCIGDSLDHDIKGAAAAGCDSVLVSTGIYESLSNEEFREKLDNAVCVPNYVYGDRV